jgi:GNAT superfamily N-acetyltransferase
LRRPDLRTEYDATMGDDLSGFRLRELAPDDGPGIGRLFDASPDTGMIRFRPSFQVDPYVALTYDGKQAGVVVEREGAAGPAGLAGLGLVELGEMMLRGRRSRYALLHSLVVHPDVRRRGIARAIIDWRLARAHAELGEDAVIAATIQKSNAGSFAAADRWATQFSAPISSVAMGLPSSAPAAARDGWQVRVARADDLGAYAAGYSTFHADFDLWPPGDVASLDEWLGLTPVPGARTNDLWVVADGRGELLAGIGTTEVRRSSILHVDRLPVSMRLLDAIVHIVPKGGSMEMIRFGKMWFRPGAETAARHLFASVRWEARARGNVIAASYDERGPMGRIIRPPRWLARTSFSLALRAPDELRPDHPIEPVQ